MMLPKFSRYEYAILYSDEVDFSNDLIEKHKNYMFKTSEIKRLIRSHELVEKWQGLEAAKIKVNLLRTFGLFDQADQLQQAVNDVESCMEVSNDSN